jgi:hypothetical protein
MTTRPTRDRATEMTLNVITGSCVVLVGAGYPRILSAAIAR